ncbi:MAG: cobalamin-dependent protein [Chloroflexota bacterium]
MRVLLIATNRHHRLMSRMEARPLPIGLAYVAGHLDQARHPRKLLDLMFSDDYLADVEEAIKTFRPGVVGLSIRNLDNGSYLDPQWALPTTGEVVERVRSLSPATIVCGGPAFSIFPQECFAYVKPDLGVAGDAGETFAKLVDRLESRQPYFDLPGLVYREDGAIQFNGVRASSTFSKPPSLEDLDLAKYRQAGFGIGVLTKLGDFYYPTIASTAERDEAAWRVIRPIGDVVDEVKDMEQRLGLRKVFFIDNGFNIPLSHAKSLCQALLDAGLKLHWNTCLAPHSCDAELISMMKQSGCALVLLAGQGGDSHEGIPLGQHLDQLRQVCRLCEAGGLHYIISQNFGGPDETRETVEEKLAFLRTLSPALANLRVGVRLLPGSAVSARALQEGMISGETDLLRPTFYLAAPVRDWIVEHLRSEASQHPRWNLM